MWQYHVTCSDVSLLSSFPCTPTHHTHTYHTPHISHTRIHTHTSPPHIYAIAEYLPLDKIALESKVGTLRLLRSFVVASLTIAYPPSSYCLFQRIAEQNCQEHETDFTLLAVGCSLNVKYNELKSYTYALSVWWISLLFYLLFVARLTLAWFFNSLHMAHDQWVEGWCCQVLTGVSLSIVCTNSRVSKMRKSMHAIAFYSGSIMHCAHGTTVS